MPELEPGSEFDFSDVDLLAAAAAHGLLTIARIRAENPNRRLRITREFLINYEQHIADPNYDMRADEDRELIRRLHSFDPEALTMINDAVSEYLDQA